MLKSLFLKTCLAISALMLPVPQVSGQQLSPDEFAEKTTRVKERRESVAVYPSSVSGTGLSDAGLVAGDKDKRAFINYVIHPVDANFDIVLSASSPLAESGATNLAQLSGLTNKTRFGAQWHIGKHRLPSAKENAVIFATLWPQCQELLAKMPETPEKKAVSERGCNFEELDADTVEKALKPYRRVSWFVTAKGELGPEGFSFVDATNFADTKQRKWSQSGSVAAGFLLPNNVYTSAGVRLERAFKASKDQAVCAPPTGANAACPIKAFGEPAKLIRKVIEAEVRSFLGPHAGISSIVRYDWAVNEKSVEVPVYFVQDKEGGLRGGVAYAHSWTRTQGAGGHQFSVFVGQAFKLGA